MPSRFEKYRVKDGLTKLGEAFFNPVFQDIDLRIGGLENLHVSWDEAVRAVTDFGLARVNEVIGPTLLDATTKAAEIEAKRLAASTALTALMAAIDSYEAVADVDILTFKSGVNAAIATWQASVNADIAALSASVATAESGATSAISAWQAAQLASLQAWQASVNADIATLSASVATAESGASSAISAWQATQLASLQAWQATLEGSLPTINGRLDTVEAALPGKAAVSDLAALQSSLTTQLNDKASQVSVDTLSGKIPTVVVPDDAGNFTIAADSNGQLAVISGYGLYRFNAASTDIADGETMIAPSSGGGNWVLESPHWDFVWAYLAGLFDDLQDRFLSGSASLDFPSIAAGATATLTATMTGASTTDRVVLTAPATLPANLYVRAYVSAPDTLTVVANNVSAAAIDPAAMTYLYTVLKS